MFRVSRVYRVQGLGFLNFWNIWVEEDIRTNPAIPCSNLPAFGIGLGWGGSECGLGLTAETLV